MSQAEENLDIEPDLTRRRQHCKILTKLIRDKAVIKLYCTVLHTIDCKAMMV